jgi:hypothetical protein
MLSPLRREAEKRGLLAEGVQLSAGSVFSLVRDMPYQRASSREAEAILLEWRGTCSGKHYLLKSLFVELGFEARVVMCTHQFTPANTTLFPPSLQEQVAAGPVPDVHTFVRLKTECGWMDVDATWPLHTRHLGMAVNEEFQPGVNMRIACDPVAIFEVPKGVEPQSFKEQLIKQYCGPQMARRDQFIVALSQWLVEEG